MNYNIPIKELITTRHSVRTYDDRPIEDEKLNILKDTIKAISEPYFRCEIVHLDVDKKEKLGTYGMIKGASKYIVAIFKQDEISDLSKVLEFGYRFEELVLKATDMGLGTCWMAGSFKVKSLQEKVNLQGNEQIVMVSPIGYQKHIRTYEKALRKLAKADIRKPWSELFFLEDFSQALVGEQMDKYANYSRYADGLEMVRKGPSASNKQPWRLVITKESIDFYVPNKNMEYSIRGYNLAVNDIGIATCHLQLTLEEAGIKGTWARLENKKRDGYEYMCSWQEEN